ncbi:MAG: hypothetical protein LBI54_01995 [Lachnospiraceae bacterium]|jgi:hypothetical protein|nr:hypothetical protein [Lachnospiraceae bacterium]
MKIIASRVIAVYNEEFSDDKIKALERRLLRVDAEANKAVDASIAAPAKSRQRYYDKLDQMNPKTNLLVMANGFVVTVLFNNK